MIESGLFLGIDQGGTTTTALLFAPGTGVLATRSVPMPKRTPSPGVVEHDPWDFLSTSLSAAEAALFACRRQWRDVRAIGIANQGETSMAWSADGTKTFGPALSWEDRRTTGYCESLAEHGVDRLVRQRTGIMLDPYFSASKFHWLLHAGPAAEVSPRNAIKLSGTDSFVMYQLTRGDAHATDHSTASRTALFDIRRLRWDEELASCFSVDMNALPQVRATIGDFGWARHETMPASGIPITTDVVDAHAALFAQACFDQANIKATFGTGAFIEVNTGTTLVEPDGKLPVFVAWHLGRVADYTIEGGIYSVGSAIDWAVGTGLVDSAQATSDLAFTVPDAGGVTVVPSFTGIAAPYWKPSAKALITGAGLDTTAAHIVRALLDGIAFAGAEVIGTINQRLGGSIKMIKSDGGPSRNPYLMQRYADLCGLPVIATEEKDMTALGAALLAALGAGQLTLDDVRALPRRVRTYEPDHSGFWNEKGWSQWRKCIAAADELSQ